MVTRIITGRTMSTDLALTRLLQLVSPSLPIGGYTYSQGIEWAAEAGWIDSEQDLGAWLQGLLETGLTYLEVPVLLRMMDAWRNADHAAVGQWNDYLLASRETRELKTEELNRARAFCQVLNALEPDAAEHRELLIGSQHACFSYACNRWSIDNESAAHALAWSWLENLVLAAVKIIPLGQTAGQRVLFRLAARLPEVIERALQLDDDELGASSLALAIASSQHETQYTRLFRS
jgi:urease accessory protein